MSVETQLLESYLKRLGLTTFIHNHSAFAVDAAQSQHSYDRYLLALAHWSEIKEKPNLSN